MKTSSRNTRRLRILIAVPAVIATAVVIAALNLSSDGSASAAPAKTDKSKTSFVQFDKDGELVKPTGYRKWTYVGTPLTPNDMNDGKAPFPEFHSVYMNPDAYNHYERPVISRMAQC